MQATAAILSCYEDEGWRSRVLCGAPLQQVYHWIDRVESNPPVPEQASGKPLAWLILLTGLHQSDQPIRVIRQIGLQTDVLRTLEHELTRENLTELEDLFARNGKPYGTGPTDTLPFC